MQGCGVKTASTPPSRFSDRLRFPAQRDTDVGCLQYQAGVANRYGSQIEACNRLRSRKEPNTAFGVYLEVDGAERNFGPSVFVGNEFAAYAVKSDRVKEVGREPKRRLKIPNPGIRVFRQCKICA